MVEKEFDILITDEMNTQIQRYAIIIKLFIRRCRLGQVYRDEDSNLDQTCQKQICSDVHNIIRKCILTVK